MGRKTAFKLAARQATSPRASSSNYNYPGSETMDTKDGTTAPVAETPAPDRETDPNTNDAGAAPAAEPATGGDAGQLDQSRDHTGDAKADATESEEAYHARVKAEREAFERMRAETPPQTVKLRPEAKQALLGVVVHFHDAPPRCIRMEDWRTDQVTLKAGDRIVIVVLAGEDLDTFERYQRIEQRAKEPQKAPISQAEKDADEACSIASGAGNHDQASDSAVGTGS
ncbi:MAG TPA: hypothetical protein VM756_04210 [Burkholderiales bacterium]|nr:hypothetical protein [Burkholderiales bacterium]